MFSGKQTETRYVFLARAASRRFSGCGNLAIHDDNSLPNNQPIVSLPIFPVNGCEQYLLGDEFAFEQDL